MEYSLHGDLAIAKSIDPDRFSIYNDDWVKLITIYDRMV